MCIRDSCHYDHNSLNMGTTSAIRHSSEIRSVFQDRLIKLNKRSCRKAGVYFLNSKFSPPMLYSIVEQLFLLVPHIHWCPLILFLPVNPGFTSAAHNMYAIPWLWYYWLSGYLFLFYLSAVIFCKPCPAYPPHRAQYHLYICRKFFVWFSLLLFLQWHSKVCIQTLSYQYLKLLQICPFLSIYYVCNIFILHTQVSVSVYFTSRSHCF